MIFNSGCTLESSKELQKKTKHKKKTTLQFGTHPSSKPLEAQKPLKAFQQKHDMENDMF